MIKATAQSGDRSKFQVPPGTYPARIYRIVHIGTVETHSDQYGDKLQNQVWIDFELPTKKAVFNEEKGEQPYSVSMILTASTHEKAAMRKVIDSLNGEPLTPEQAAEFNVEELLGSPCLVTVIKNSAGNPKVQAVVPLPDGLDCPSPVNRPVIFNYDQFDRSVFDSLPQFLRDRIMSSKEWAQMVAPEATETANEENDEGAPEEIPFE